MRSCSARSVCANQTAVIWASRVPFGVQNGEKKSCKQLHSAAPRWVERERECPVCPGFTVLLRGETPPQETLQDPACLLLLAGQS